MDSLQSKLLVSIDYAQESRTEILAKLDSSLKSFSLETILTEKLPAQDTTQGSKALAVAKRVLEAGRKARSNLNVFWHNIERYSTEPLPCYMQCCSISIRDPSSQDNAVEIYTFDNLETLWEKIKIKSLDRGHIIVCSPLDKILPKAKRAKDLERSRTSDPEPGAVCESAVVAFLFLVRETLQLSFTDLYHLINTIHGSEPTEELPLLPNLYEDDVELPVTDPTSSTGDYVKWHTFESAYTFARELKTSSTKNLLFPGPLPYFRTDLQYMEIWEPHGSHPSSTALKSSVWGAWRDDHHSWTSIAMFANANTGKVFGENITKMLSKSPATVVEVLSHWTHLMKYMYAIGVNDARLNIRDALSKLESLRYLNTAHPSTGFAQACVMYLNYFEYYRRSIEFVQLQVYSFPSKWDVYPPSGPPPPWLQAVFDSCAALEVEISKAFKHVEAIRTVALEQHSLHQSRKATVLTILASIFVPISFVATFFGMNVEPFANSGNATFHGFENQRLSGANGPSLDGIAFNGTIVQPASNNPVPLKYFFIAAVPLAIVSVMVPLLIVPLLTMLVRSAVIPGATWKRMHVGFWVLIFVLNLVNDILSIQVDKLQDRLYSVVPSEGPESEQQIYSNIDQEDKLLDQLFPFWRFGSSVSIIMAIVFGIQLLVALVWIARRGKVWAQKRRMIRRRKWWIALWCCLVIIYYATYWYEGYYFLNLLPFVVGFGALFWQSRRRRRRASSLSGGE